MVARTIHDAGMSLRTALRYSGLNSWSSFYYEEKSRFVEPDPLVVKSVKRLTNERPSYGARRVAAQLSRDLGHPVNRKRIQRIFRILGYTEPSLKKSEIIRSHDRAPSPSRPYELWQTDLTYTWCGRDSWGYLFNAFDAFSRVWAGYQFDTTAVKENAILSIENALISHKERVKANLLTLRADNGPQYTSHAFKDSMKALGLRLEHIAYRTPEQNGAIESFHKTLKKEYLWCQDFRNYQEAEIAIADAFKDYNHSRIHSALGYKTPYEYLSSYYLAMKKKEEEEERKV